MSIKNRLAKLEKTLGTFSCPRCRDSDLRQVCTYEEEPDGTRRLVSGTPPAPCPQCGRIPSGDGHITEIIVALPPESLTDSESDIDEEGDLRISSEDAPHNVEISPTCSMARQGSPKDPLPVPVGHSGKGLQLGQTDRIATSIPEGQE